MQRGEKSVRRGTVDTSQPGVIPMRRALLTLLIAIVIALPSRADTNWPQFRGPSGGVAEDRGIPEEWSTTKNVVWKADLPGRGWSSPIVWGRRIFLTTVVKDGDYEAPKKGLYFGGERAKPSPDIHHWIVLCLDWDTGNLLWQREVHKGPPASTVHVKNTYASETPVTDGERVYAYFGNVGIFCLDMEGKELWSKKWSSFKTANGWGTAASPVLHKHR